MPLFAGLHGDRRLLSPAFKRTRTLPFPSRWLSEMSILPPRPSLHFSAPAEGNGPRSFATYLFRSCLLRGRGHILQLLTGVDSETEPLTAEKSNP